MSRVREALGRSKPAQCELDLREDKVPVRSGFREGAGRKRKPDQHDSRHRVRTALKAYHPVHVVLRVKKGVGRLRKGVTHRAIRRSLSRRLGDPTFRVCHVSIQANHLHFLVEASDRHALAKGMQRLNISLARTINLALGRRGTLFAFRYHATQIKSPRQVRHCLSYVLNNWRRHDEDESCLRAQLAKLDPYASGLSFDGWTMPFDTPAGFELLPVSRAKTWLLTIGWRRHPLIDPREVPGALGGSR